MTSLGHSLLDENDLSTRLHEGPDVGHGLINVGCGMQDITSNNNIYELVLKPCPVGSAEMSRVWYVIRWPQFSNLVLAFSKKPGDISV